MPTTTCRGRGLDEGPLCDPGLALGLDGLVGRRRGHHGVHHDGLRRAVKLDFNTDGTITLVGGTVVPSITSTVIPAHTHAGPAHSHSGPSHIHAVFTAHLQNIGSTSGTLQSHTHSYSGGTTGGQNQTHTHELNHTHEMDDTGASGTGQTSINGTAATSSDGGSTHSRDTNTFAPTWISSLLGLNATRAALPCLRQNTRITFLQALTGWCTVGCGETQFA
uniref:hypothetical protein n=1 Tax=Streptomyces rimosus TaxID=1927 RepID=UPI00131DF58F|nr:hypothetical protein [Streptomyces rimosus]